jgi:hypothetical protein
VRSFGRELNRQAADVKPAPERLKRLIRGGYVYRNDDEHFLTDKGRDALAQLRVQPGDGTSTEESGFRNGQRVRGMSA